MKEEAKLSSRTREPARSRAATAQPGGLRVTPGDSQGGQA
jgi:hypothetical protein